MSASSAGRVWLLFWLLVAIVLLPALLAVFLFEVNQFEVGALFALLGLLVWLIAQGAGWRYADKDTAVIVRDPTGNYSAYNRASYLFIPFAHQVVAQLPTYPLTFEFPIEAIDTQTRYLSRIVKIVVRVTCTISDPRTFYLKSDAFLDRILELEATTQFRRTDKAFWKQMLREIMAVEVDNHVRDVVWRWQEHIDRDPSLRLQTTFTLKKLGELDPFDLSVNRQNLARETTASLAKAARAVGVKIEPLVFESVEIDPGLIAFKNLDQDRELAKAEQAAALARIPIVERGMAEAEVRATTLAKLLDVLINQYHIPHTDPLVAQVIRAVLYSDGEMIWKGVLEKSPNGSAAKAA